MFEIFYIFHLFYIFNTFLKLKKKKSHNRTISTSILCVCACLRENMFVCNCRLSFLALSPHCTELWQTTCFWLESRHTGTLTADFTIFLTWIWTLANLGWNFSGVFPCGWVLVYVTLHLPTLSDRLLMCGVVSSFECSVRKSCHALLIQFFNLGSWTIKKLINGGNVKL